MRGFGSARICVGSGPGLPALAMKEASVCARLALLTSLCLTEFGRFFLLLPNIHVRACVECVFEDEGKKTKPLTVKVISWPGHRK